MVLTAVNGGPEHTLQHLQGQFLRDGAPVGEVEITADTIHSLDLVLAGCTYRVLVLGFDAATHTLRLQVAGKEAEVVLTSQAQLYAKRIGLSNLGALKVSELRAPMPGLVRAVHVQPGQAVQKGDALLTLEAMKMENILKAPAEGIVSAVPVVVGAAVEKGQLLVGFE